MIADLSQHSLSLIFEVNSPLYQEFELDYRKKETNYEDFITQYKKNLDEYFSIQNNVQNYVFQQIPPIPIGDSKEWLDKKKKEDD